MSQTVHLHWLEISRSALLHNLSQYRHYFSPQTKIMAMVKANAYGHGLNEISGILKNKADFFAVNTVSEAITIRIRDKKTPILITAPVSSSDFHYASQNHISLCIPSLDYLTQLTASNLKLAAHLKINTGTNRLGLSPLELLPAVDILRHSKQLTVEGIYTHFHSSDSGSPQSLIQLDIFNQAVSQTKYYFPKSIAHCSSSSSALLWPRAHLDMIRVGIALYGLWPDKFVKSHAPPKFTLKPVLSWFCRPVQIRRVDTGETVGYSATYTYYQPGVMAILPIGYSDGYDRKLSNAGRVWTRGVYCPVIGRIAMNFTAIDISKVTGTTVKKNRAQADAGNYQVPEHDFLNGKPVEIIGPHIPADEIATALGTINYEVVSRLNPAIPRLIVK